MDQCNTATQVLTTLDTQIYNTGHEINFGSSWHAVSWASTLQTLQFTTMLNKNFSYPLPQKVQILYSQLPISSEVSLYPPILQRPACNTTLHNSRRYVPACLRKGALLPSYDNKKTACKHSSRHLSTT